MDAEKLMMQRRIDNLIEQLEIVKRERDAAIIDLRAIPVCRACKHYAKKQGLEIPDVCIKCVTGRKRQFEWRGPCEENGGKTDD